jgi:hypothetical protein
MAATNDFRLTVLSPGDRDPEQNFAEGAGEPGLCHPPTNFHGYAACTRGTYDRAVKRTVTRSTPVLLLLRGDFKESERALRQLKRAGTTVAVSLKETGLHQIADQLRNANKFARFTRIIAAADGCIGATPEAADVYRQIRGDSGSVAFIPTPSPLDDPRWDFSRPIAERSGIFIGTREFDVLSRNHLAALLLARQLSDATGEGVTVYNFDGRKGERLLSTIGFGSGKLRIRNRRLQYPDYLRDLAQHKIVLQLDTSFVPGQVAGDALLARLLCVGGNGAVDRVAFPDLCGFKRSVAEVAAIARKLLTNGTAYEQQLQAMNGAAEQLAFGKIAHELRGFFSGL